MIIIKTENAIYGLYDDVSNTWIVKPIYKFMCSLNISPYYILIKTVDNLCGIINTNGDFIVRPIYAWINYYNEIDRFALQYKGMSHYYCILKNNNFYIKKFLGGKLNEKM